MLDYWGNEIATPKVKRIDSLTSKYMLRGKDRNEARTIASKVIKAKGRTFGIMRHHFGGKNA